MFKNKLFLIIVGVLLAVIFYSFFQSQDGVTKLSYSAKLQQYRSEMDKTIVDQKDSPILDRSLFKGLKYFAADSTFIIKGTFTKVDTAKLAMTDGSNGETKQVGVVQFSRNGRPYQLLMFKEDKKYFLPFQDETNNIETYGGGRYLTVDPKTIDDDEITLDFNYSYNPYCAYNHTYVCPVPPKQNKLAFAVRAGEKKLLDEN